MEKQPLLDLLTAYHPTDELEIFFKKQFIEFVSNYDNFALRSNLTGQVTASAWLINSTKTKAVLIHHKKLDKWLQIGGHIEPEDQNIQQTALREVTEESGLSQIKLLSEQIFDLDIHTIPEKNDVPKHLHLDIRFLVEADENELFTQNEEVKGIAWYDLEDLKKIITNSSIQRMISKTILLRVYPQD